jgi:hypothetical protein
LRDFSQLNARHKTTTSPKGEVAKRVGRDGRTRKMPTQTKGQKMLREESQLLHL